MPTATADIKRTADTKPRKPLPAPNSDFYQLTELLSDDEAAMLKQVRAFMETKVAPIINKYWVEDAFPFELLPAFKELNIGGLGMKGYGCRGGGPLLFGLIAMEMARVDSSIATFFGVLFAGLWPVGLIAGATWLAVAAIFRYSSLAALTAALVAPIAAWALNLGAWGIGFCALIGALIYWRHRANIARLVKGGEPKIGAKKNEAA